MERVFAYIFYFKHIDVQGGSMIKVFELKRLWYIILVLIILFVSAEIIFTAEYKGKELPVLMYHSILKDPNSTGKYVVTPKSLEDDIKYLTSRGYKAVSAKEVKGYVSGENDLPEKAYMITFDDGCYNNLTYVLPILEKYDACAVISIVGSYSERFSVLNETNPAYSYLRWCDIEELFKSSRVEFANHSYDFHNYDHKRMGAKIKKNEDSTQYCKLFKDDLDKTHNLLFENCDILTDIYTYPYGAYCEESEKILAESGYTMTFTCNEGINILTQNESDLRLLKRFNRHGLVSTEAFFKKCNIR